MHSAKDIFERVKNSLSTTINKEERTQITYQLLQKVLGVDCKDVTSGRFVNRVNWQSMEAYIKRLNQHEPIQYILGRQEFYGHSFLVDHSTLIPRPETEHLIDEVLVHFGHKDNQSPITIMDIGTGSGCIAVTLMLEIKDVVLHATDCCEKALSVAQKNAKQHGVNIFFHCNNVIKELLPKGAFDLIVSNPPYIMHSEKQQIDDRVLCYEPHKALFAPRQDAMLFYKSIAVQAKDRLKKQGMVIVEINERNGAQVTEIFSKEGYSSVKILQDYAGRNRIVEATY